MRKYSFTVNGVDMRERFGLIVERFEDVLAPQIRARKVVLPMRDGAYDFGAQYYEERLITVHCAAVQLDREACRELAHILSAKATIARWDEPDKYYLGRIYDAPEMERLVGSAKHFALTFVCDPFAYGRTVQEAIGGRMAYGGTARTPTRIEIYNAGSAAVQGVRIRMRRRME